MNFILLVDFIDVSHMAAALVMKHSVHFKDDTRRQNAPGSPHHDTETILLRGPLGEVSRDTWFADVPHADTELLAKWPSARAVLAKIAESHLARSGVVPIFGKAMVISLKPNGWVDWHMDQGSYAEAHDRFHVCLIPSAGALLFCGGQTMSLQVGSLCWVNNRALHSAVNFGANARVHLVVDIRKPESIQ